MDETGMTPRITVPDRKDALLVQEALVVFAEGVCAAARAREILTAGDALMTAALVDRITTLLDCLHSDTHTTEGAF